MIACRLAFGAWTRPTAYVLAAATAVGAAAHPVTAEAPRRPAAAGVSPRIRCATATLRLGVVVAQGDHDPTHILDRRQAQGHADGEPVVDVARPGAPAA